MPINLTPSLSLRCDVFLCGSALTGPFCFVCHAVSRRITFAVGYSASLDHPSLLNSDNETRVTIFGDSSHVDNDGYSTRVTFFTEWRLESQPSTRLESRFSENDSNRVTIKDSRLESESFLQNLWASDRHTQFVRTQRNELFFFRQWSRL